MPAPLPRRSSLQEESVDDGPVPRGRRSGWRSQVSRFLEDDTRTSRGIHEGKVLQVGERLLQPARRNRRQDQGPLGERRKRQVLDERHAVLGVRAGRGHDGGPDDQGGERGVSHAGAERVATQTRRDRAAGATGGTPALADRVPAPIAARRERPGRQAERRAAPREIAARGGHARARRRQIGTIDRSFINILYCFVFVWVCLLEVALV